MILIHNFIPHHHHTTHSARQNKSKHCEKEKSNNHSSKQEEQPFHCHAYNDVNLYVQNASFNIVSEPVVNLFVEQSITTSLKFDCVDKYELNTIPLKYHKIYLKHQYSRPPPLS